MCLTLTHYPTLSLLKKVPPIAVGRELFTPFTLTLSPNQSDRRKRTKNK